MIITLNKNTKMMLDHVLLTIKSEVSEAEVQRTKALPPRVVIEGDSHKFANHFPDRYQQWLKNKRARDASEAAAHEVLTQKTNALTIRAMTNVLLERALNLPDFPDLVAPSMDEITVGLDIEGDLQYRVKELELKLIGLRRNGPAFNKDGTVRQKWATVGENQSTKALSTKVTRTVIYNTALGTEIEKIKTKAQRDQLLVDMIPRGRARGPKKSTAPMTPSN